MRLRIAFAAGIFVWLLSCLPAMGQEFRSTISGRVIDQQQAAVPNVKIVCTNTETAARYETVSANDGGFALPFLPPGPYTLEAQGGGFKAYVRKGIQVTTNERMQLDIALELGQLAETVTITAEAPVLETATASTGQLIDSRQMENMPANGRTPLVLAQLAAGIIPNTSPRFVRPFDNGGSSTFSMGGAPATTNELLIDGAPDVGAGGAVAYNPPMDAVTELKVESFQADAAYGHTGGGTVNVLTKSGTNTLHGSAYEFNQVSALAATSFFLNASRQKKNVTRYNQWGANSGGPVYFPKVFDGRNKLFFFFSYEGVRDGLPRPNPYSVPTDAERNGDFSALLKLGSQYTIYDPATGVQQGSRIQRTPFPNNIIPSTRIGAIAKNLTPFWPQPNNPTNADGVQNYQSHEMELNKFDNELTRVDLNAGIRNKLAFNFRHNLRWNTQNVFDNIAKVSLTHRLNWGGGMDHVLTLSPTTLLNYRLSYTRYLSDGIAAAKGYDIVKAGFPASLAAAAAELKLPAISFGTISSIGSGGSSVSTNDTYQIFAALTKVRGAHTLKTGVDLRLYRNSAGGYGNSTGTYTFGTNWTRGPLDNSTAAPIGQDWAAFLLGLPTSGSVDVNGSSVYQAGYYSIFLQDDFRVRSDLTLNVGIRYERDLPTTERFNRTVNGFDSTTSSPIAAAAIAAYAKSPIAEVPASQFKVNGGLLFAGPNRRNIYNTEANNFSPRFGFAWKPAALGGKTVIRGGVGVYYFPIGAAGVVQTGFSQSTSLVPTNDGYLTPYATLSNPFPDGISQPVGSTQGIATYLGKGISFYNPDPLNPYSVRWTFNIQRELPGRITVEAGYQGNHAVHLTDSMSLTYTPAQFLSTLPFRDTAVINRLSANVTNPFANLLPGSTINGSTIAVSSLLTAYPQFTGVSVSGLNEGSSYFHLGSIRVEKRLSHGLTIGGNYQYSKMMGRLSRLNPSDVQLEKAVASDDRPRRLVVSGSYDLPFGRGKKIGSNVPKLVNGIIGDWNINGIHSRQSGGVLGWGNVIYYGGPLQLDSHNPNRMFDITQFNRNSTQQLASNLRTFPSSFGSLRADSPNNYSFSAIKQFPIRERLKLQYRCEFFNAFNHPVFRSANTSPTSSAFGTQSAEDSLARVIQMALRLTW
jgi:hypothetical protein